jgi:surface antigen
VRKTLILLVAATVMAMPSEVKAALQCVTYAREVTGLNLKGDAWKWWEAAQGVYDRGRAPKEGSVLVFSRQGRMSHGHVAVVRKVVSSRELLIDHANWAPVRTAGRGKITEAVPVIDVSPKNDWSQVRVWYGPASSYGDHTYKTQGFIYNPNKPRMVIPASLRAETAESAPSLDTVTSVPQPEITLDPAPVNAASEEPPAPASAAPVVAPAPASAAPVVATVDPVIEPPAPVPAMTPPAQLEQPAQIPAAISPVKEAAEPERFDARPWAEQA